MLLEAQSQSAAQLQALSGRIITRIMGRLTCAGDLIEEEGMSYLGDHAAPGVAPDPLPWPARAPRQIESRDRSQRTRQRS